MTDAIYVDFLDPNDTGLGRSGIVAAACLVALGHAPDEAIDRVRLARPGAVETREQERWVEAYAQATRRE